jgi:hypothetical protein
MENRITGNYRVNEKLVKIIDTPDGEFDILAYDIEKDESICSPRYLSMIMYGREDMEKLSDEDLEKGIKMKQVKFKDSAET